MGGALVWHGTYNLGFGVAKLRVQQRTCARNRGRLKDEVLDVLRTLTAVYCPHAYSPAQG